MTDHDQNTPKYSNAQYHEQIAMMYRDPQRSLEQRKPQSHSSQPAIVISKLGVTGANETERYPLRPIQSSQNTPSPCNRSFYKENSMKTFVAETKENDDAMLHTEHIVHSNNLANEAATDDQKQSENPPTLAVKMPEPCKTVDCTIGSSNRCDTSNESFYSTNGSLQDSWDASVALDDAHQQCADYDVSPCNTADNKSPKLLIAMESMSYDPPIRRRRTDSTTIILPIPSLRGDWDSATTPPSNKHDGIFSDDESVFDFSPEYMPVRRRTGSFSLLLPYPSLRDEMTMASKPRGTIEQVPSMRYDVLTQLSTSGPSPLSVSPSTRHCLNDDTTMCATAVAHNSSETKLGNNNNNNSSNNEDYTGTFGPRQIQQVAGRTLLSTIREYVVLQEQQEEPNLQFVTVQEDLEHRINALLVEKKALENKIATLTKEESLKPFRNVFDAFNTLRATVTRLNQSLREERIDRKKEREQYTTMITTSLKSATDKALEYKQMAQTAKEEALAFQALAEDYKRQLDLTKRGPVTRSRRKL
jgi:hypothetical protein